MSPHASDVCAAIKTDSFEAEVGCCCRVILPQVEASDRPFLTPVQIHVVISRFQKVATGIPTFTLSSLGF